MFKFNYLPTFVVLLLLLVNNNAVAQDLTIIAEPATLTIALGDSASIDVKALDKDGNVKEGVRTMIFAQDRRSLSISRSSSMIKALASGTHSITAGTMLMQDGERQFYSTNVTVNVPYPPVKEIAFNNPPSKAYAGTTMSLDFDVMDEAGVSRDNVNVMVTSSNPDIATVDAFQNLVAHKTGTVTLFAEAENAKAETQLSVVANPVTSVTIGKSHETARTGDVLSFKAMAMDKDGNAVTDAPVSYTFRAQTDDQLGPASSGQIDEDGRFVAEQPGLYTIMAMSGSVLSQQSVKITQRDVSAEVEFIGKGIVSDVHTSDLWVWEGVDGRDYAVTGTWGANGEAYFWDVTDPATPAIIDTVTVDARTVNDVKVSEDGTVCVISREGASNRRNGLVILDCTNPYDVQIHAEFDENLTGGVHNVFIYQNHIYALSAGRRYDIINIDDPKNPQRVGKFELDTPGHSIHDVWVVDGIAYSSNWDDGVVMVDVGNGIAGGSITNPVQITSYAYPSGWNHAAFPYHSEETGKRYIIAGDEAFPDGNPAGWIHFIDVTDLENPKEVARYEVPEAGTHNLWVEDDKLYIAYYQGGLRVVDISGDLMGDLYRQGREIAKYKAADPEGKVANSPMAWGPQPYKGNVFISDMNSGLWVVKVKEDKKEQQPDI